jgi:hypothetical protein
MKIRRESGADDPIWLDMVEIDVDPIHESGQPSTPRTTLPARPLPSLLILCAVCLAVVTFMSALILRQHRGRTITSTLTLTAPVAIGSDATGCPLGASCTPFPDVPQLITAAIQKVLPGAKPIYAGAIGNADTAITYSAIVTVRASSGVTITTRVQCAPLGRPISPSSATIGSDATVVVAGDPGCSVAVTAHAPTGVALPVATLEMLAHNQDLQLHQ